MVRHPQGSEFLSKLVLFGLEVDPIIINFLTRLESAIPFFYPLFPTSACSFDFLTPLV